MVYDVDDVVGRLDDLVVKLEKIEDELRNVRRNGGSTGVILFLAILAGIWISPSHTYTTWNKFYYSMKTGIRYGNITVEQEPTDCDWIHAPLGYKDCYYKKIVNTTMYSLDDNLKPIVSYDEGKTWLPMLAMTNDKSNVVVSWEKAAGSD